MGHKICINGVVIRNNSCIMRHDIFFNNSSPLPSFEMAVMGKRQKEKLFQSELFWYIIIKGVQCFIFFLALGSEKKFHIFHIFNMSSNMCYTHRLFKSFGDPIPSVFSFLTYFWIVFFKTCASFLPRSTFSTTFWGITQHHIGSVW